MTDETISPRTPLIQAQLPSRINGYDLWTHREWGFYLTWEDEMATRRWVLKWNYGYAGADNADVVDIVDFLGLTEEEADAMTEDEALRQLSDMVWEQAIEQVEAYARPAREGEDSWQDVGSDD